MRKYLPAAAIAVSSLIFSGCNFFSPSAAIAPPAPEAASASAPPLLKTAAAVSLPFRADFESESAECWGRRDGSGYNRPGCGNFVNIGPHGISLATNGIRRSGSKALKATYIKNEDVAGSVLRVDEENIHVRTHFYFDKGFDFGQGVKIGRVSSFNDAKQANDVDIILAVGSSAGNQCGQTDMGYLGLHFNGRPTGYDWGSITPSISFQRERWYSVEYQVSLNTPGQKNGLVRLWVDGKMVGEKTGLNIRGGGGSSVRLNRVLIGGWYSNSARGNRCSAPSGPSSIYMDDIEIARSYIGPLSGSSEAPTPVDSPTPSMVSITPVWTAPVPVVADSPVSTPEPVVETLVPTIPEADPLTITYTRNEQEAGVTHAVAAETLYVRGKYYFDRSFDFPQGMAIGRITGDNSEHPTHGIDVVVRTHSVPGNQCGVTDMRGIGIYSKERDAGNSWSAVNYDFSFERQRWYDLEYALILNQPGQKNGEARIWVNGQLIAEASGIDTRGSLPDGPQIKAVRLGGWYSNGGNGNGCPSPDQPSRMLIDDVVLARNR